jgi:2-dehydropantoate 2-reductase
VVEAFCERRIFSTTGATGLTIAEVAAISELRATALRAIDKAAAVALANGIDVSEKERREIFDTLFDLNGAGANTTSMYRDLETGRRTEVDYIYGRAIAMGDACGVATPTLKNLATLIKGQEARNARVESLSSVAVR